jgi:hypothetical protein
MILIMTKTLPSNNGNNINIKLACDKCHKWTRISIEQYEEWQLSESWFMCEDCKKEANNDKKNI